MCTEVTETGKNDSKVYYSTKGSRKRSRKKMMKKDDGSEGNIRYRERKGRV